jgi:uncharacterized DUF497 family protein
VGFEWDEAKARQNLARHGVDFGGAIAVFEDPLRLEIEDDRFDYGEKRFKAVGLVQDVVLVVVFTYRGDSIRIISGRES